MDRDFMKLCGYVCLWLAGFMVLGYWTLCITEELWLTWTLR